MTAHMHDNPNFEAGTSHRRKIIEEFEINLNRCILCGICVDVCSFDAIEMSYEHELASYARAGARADLPTLLSQGRRYVEMSSWVPENAEKNVAITALSKRAAVAAARAGAEPTEAGTQPAAAEGSD
jgi:formate hydrogenlyase subunit 6/NADH:ubiquinone oxidoreductase subunit I